MKNTKINFVKIKLLIIVLFVLIFNSVKSQSIYFKDIDQVYTFEPPGTDGRRSIYWDLTEINSVNNRLDLGAGINHDPFTSGDYDYVNGSWYKNENNSNFNSYNEDLRFTHAENTDNIINGFIFLKNYTTSKRDAIVTRGSGRLEVYNNSNGTLNSGQYFYVGGSLICTRNIFNRQL